jgi:hypothetical protein
MRKRAALAAIFVLFASSAPAQMPQRAEDHLEPDHAILEGPSFSDSYENDLRDKFKEAYERGVVLRMIALPSFIPEFAVGLRGSSSTYGLISAPYHIFTLTPAASIWTYQTINSLKLGLGNMPARDKMRKVQEQQIAKEQASVPSDIRDLAVHRCETDISDSLGSRIITVWSKMLLRTHYSSRYTAGADGATYHFSMFLRGSGDMNGHVWLPRRDSATGNLVALADAMRVVCKKKVGADEASLEKLTTELEQRLQ